MNINNKKLKKRISLALASIILLANLAIAPFASAAETLTCDNLNPKTGDQPNEGYEKVKKMVVTINEEEIGSDEKVGEMQALYCFRQTDCTKEKGCNSLFVASCTPKTTDNDNYTACQRVQVLYAPTGADLLYGYIGLIYRYAAGTIGIVSVLFLVWGGVMIATAGDNTGRIEEAKQKIYQSIAGLILLFLSAAILYTINPNFFTL